MTKANRAIILAAGYGNRMHPVTEHTPKALVRVNGKRIIDNQIHTLHKSGIHEIYIVVGYLKEQFLPLETQYPGVHLIENPDFATGNNISSLYYARQYLDACVILDCDILFHREDMLSYEYQHSTYCALWLKNTTTEWLFRHKNLRITDVVKTGGTGWGLFSISFWTMEDAVKLRQHLTEAYETHRIRDTYWDDVVLTHHKNEYTLELRPMLHSDITEIDTYEELCALDPTYLYKE